VRSGDAAGSVAAPPRRAGARGLQSRRPGDTRLVRETRRASPIRQSRSTAAHAGRPGPGLDRWSALHKS